MKLAKKIAAVFPKNSAVSEKMEPAAIMKERFNVNSLYRDFILLGSFILQLVSRYGGLTRRGI